MYRILIVDDEAYVAHAMAEMLEKKSPRELDIYCAYHYDSALKFFSEGRFDLCLCDIQMPDKSGFDLLEKIQQCWPFCKTIFLTAFSNFDYAYNALSMHASGYVLKSEADEKILAAIEQVFQQMDEERRLKLLQENEKNQLTKKYDQIVYRTFGHLLASTPDTAKNTYTPEMLGLSDSPYCCVLVYPKPPEDTLATCKQYLEQQNIYLLSGQDGQSNTFWLMQPKTDPPLSLQLYVSQLLEQMQNDFQKNNLPVLSFLVGDVLASLEQILSACNAMRDKFFRLSSLPTPFVYACSVPQKTQFLDSVGRTVEFIKEYINQNIHQDISLLTLSNVTGYNPEYISRVFHRVTGEMLSAYISNCKMCNIKKLMRNSSLSLDEIALDSGFSSRSYFNRFVKKMTGMNPQSFRNTL